MGPSASLNAVGIPGPHGKDWFEFVTYWSPKDHFWRTRAGYPAACKFCKTVYEFFLNEVKKTFLIHCGLKMLPGKLCVCLRSWVFLQGLICLKDTKGSFFISQLRTSPKQALRKVFQNLTWCVPIIFCEQVKTHVKE